MIADCREISILYDPDNTGDNATVNQVCYDAEDFCYSEVRCVNLGTFCDCLGPPETAGVLAADPPW